jgi:hypothetical protein
MKSLYASMLDSELFGRAFGGLTFANWRTVAKLLDGLPLDARNLRYTAISRAGGLRQLIKPRRAGGTLFAPAVAVREMKAGKAARLHRAKCLIR